MTRTPSTDLECKTCGHYEAWHDDRCHVVISASGLICTCMKFLPPDIPEHRVEEDGRITYLEP